MVRKLEKSKKERKKIRVKRELFFEKVVEFFKFVISRVNIKVDSKRGEKEEPL